MFVEYHRPETIDLALQLLSRKQPETVPLSGGSWLSKGVPKPIAVVDLQLLGINQREQNGDKLELGATVKLQEVLNDKRVQPGLKKAVAHEASFNLRQTATIAGSLVTADGRSPFGTAMLALGSQVRMLPGELDESLGNLFPFRKEKLAKRLIVRVDFPMNVNLEYLYVARTPADLPIVCVALASWPSGRTRVALGGFGLTPTLAMDGPNPLGAEIAARNAYQEAGDQWASADYRSEIAGILTKRCLEKFNK